MELNDADRDAGDPSPRSRFEALYDSTFGDIYAFVARSPLTRGDIDDIVAEVYLAAWRRIDDVPPTPDDRLWMYGAARNVLFRFERSLYRRTRLSHRLSSEPTTTAPNSESVSAHPEVFDAVTKLPRREREVIQLVYWDGLAHDEAAVVVGCTTNALRIRLHRARRRLSRRLRIAEASSTEPSRTPMNLETQ